MGKFRSHAEEIDYHTRMAKAYESGQAARINDMGTVACPYRPESEIGKEWFKGYHDAAVELANHDFEQSETEKPTC